MALSHALDSKIRIKGGFMKKVLFGMFFLGAQWAYAGELIQNSADDVYQAAMEVALDLDAMPSSSNDKLRFFKTDAVKLKPSENDCDCGSMFGIPYVKDSRTVVEIKYNVRVKAVNEKSEINVSTSIVGYYDESKNAISSFMSDKKRDHDNLLDCKSKGAYEARFIEAVKNKLAK